MQTFLSSIDTDFFYFNTAAPVISTPPVNVTVIEHQEALFTCSTEGFPLPSITWTRANLDGLETVVTELEGVISQFSSGFTTTSNLTFSPTDITLNGNYSCVATNSLGLEQTSVSLTVNGKVIIPFFCAMVYHRWCLCMLTAAPIFTTPPITLCVIIPEPAMFNCSAEGFPLPSVSWRRINDDGSQTVLTEGGNIMISESSSGFITTNNLTLSPTDITLSGGYVCVASNDFGSENVSVTLEIEG